MSSRFSAGLAKLKAESQAVRPGSAETPAAPRAEAAVPVAPSRQGKKAIAAYFDPAVRKQLAMLAVQEERTQADLLAEAINLLFEKYGRSPIAKA
jgi:antitoxin-like ribbon-helix-helix protein